MTAYLTAFPDTLITFATLDEARSAADKIREVRHVKIYEVREVEHWLPTGPKGTPDPTMPPAAGGQVAEYVMAVAA